jgi:protoporphyrinogen oxidase
MKTEKQVVVIGGGPAGLVATYDLSKRKIPVVCLEADHVPGGISRTIEYKGFRFDVGGHRFFSKIQAINDLWQEVLGDEFLRRSRVSRIYYNGRFFHYPLQPMNALLGLSFLCSAQILGSYLKAAMFPASEETTFEQWVTNRFGSKLYNAFFKTYTEKVWGIPCTRIRAKWAAQRIKGLSLWTAVADALFKQQVKQQQVIKTLINEFNYPRLGPGQMYETMAHKAEKLGGEIRFGHRVTEIRHDKGRITGVWVAGGNSATVQYGTDFISTMPVTELILRLRPEPPKKVIDAARGLTYRSLLTINLLMNRRETLPDTWIYVHDPSVKMGRIQCFANWSPYMVPDKNHSSMGLEYFCWEQDEFWSMPDHELIALGKAEIGRLGLVEPDAVFDGFVVRMPKCYPVYDEAYETRLETIGSFLTGFDNLQLCGRYGLFKYNNMDHSMLTALLAVENILGANHDVWSINADDEYHEEVRNII